MTSLDPLLVTFEVNCSVEHAFRVWTDRAALWWPAGHTVSGDPESIRFEPFAGGRILERGTDGSEHVWGEVSAWQEPHRLSFWWHLFFDRVEATFVTLTFAPMGDRTLVRLEQTGFDALGAAGGQRREGNTRGWDATLRAYAEAVSAPSS